MSDPLNSLPPPGDDAVIGRAFWRSLVILGVIVMGVLGVFFFDSWKTEKRVLSETPIDAPQLAKPLVDSTPRVLWTDMTSAAGIHFNHFNGATGEKLLPETMGSGVAVFDFDGDGLQDILFVNGSDWPWTETKHQPPPTLALYRGIGAGRFEDVTAGSGLEVSFYGTGVAVGDYDNDGRVDLFVAGVGSGHFFHNEGAGKFRDVTAATGLAFSPRDWGTSAAWVDIDNDGDLDLFVCQYVQWTREIDIAVDYRLVGIGRAYGPPDTFPGSHPRLFRNEGGGRFTDISAPSGIQITNKSTGKPMSKSLGVAPVDLDRDGWMDLVVANDTVQNFVFHNERNGTFREIGAISGIAFDSYGGARGAMGIDTARVQEEDQLAIAIGNFANEMTALYVSQRNPMLFSDEAISQGIGPASRLSLTFGVFFFDYDLDGWLDFLTANGHIEQEINRVQKSQQYRQASKLYWNSRGVEGSGGFVRVPNDKVGPDFIRPLVGRASAFGDLDGDGDLDVIIAQVGGPPVLLRNDQELHHHWIRVQLQGRQSNRDGIGAQILVRLPDRVIWRQVMPTRGYLSQSELPVTIGLGTQDHIQSLDILWPSGLRQSLPPPKLDHTVRIQEPSR